MLKRRLVFLAIPLLLACEDQAPVRVATVDITPSPATVVAGQKVQLTATARDAGGLALAGRAVAWTSNNPLVAIVSATGEVSGMQAGNATITATSETASGSTVVQVTPAPVISVNISPSPVSVFVGRTQQLTTTVIDATGQVVTRPVSFSSSNPGAATVTSSGLVTGVAPGTSTVTASIEGRTATVAVTVQLVPIASLTVTPANVALNVGSTQQFTVTARDAQGNVITGRTISWNSSSQAVAAVNINGLVTAVGAGTSTITASAEGIFATGRVTVTQPVATVATVTVVPSTIILNVGSVQVLTATARDAQGNVLPRAFVWATANAAIATINQSGVVSGVSTGSTTISATTEGRTGTATVNVGTQTPVLALRSLRSNGVEIAAGGTVTGALGVTLNAATPIGFVGRVEFVFAGQIVCSVPLSGGGSQDVGCTIDTNAVDAAGVRLYPNGLTTLTGRIINAAEVSVATLDTNVTVSN